VSQCCIIKPMKYSITEQKNILRKYCYTFTALAADLGITKSYLSKIINQRVRSPKHETMIAAKILEIQKTEPQYNIKKKKYKYSKLSTALNTKDIPLRNEIQIFLDKKNITVTQLACDINEARSSVARVITGERSTARIEEKIINYLKLDSDIFNRRTVEDLEKMAEGIYLPLLTKTQAKKRYIQNKKERQSLLKAWY